VAGGDFNTFPFSMAVRRMNAVFEDAFWLSPAFFKGSYVGLSLPLNPRIDFIFHSSGLSAKDPAVHEQTAGDHLPVSAVIAID
jgi:endonuclease/exonuclease/phosphatase (EEP) superfamily protein YafD